MLKKIGFRKKKRTEENNVFVSNWDSVDSVDNVKLIIMNIIMIVSQYSDSLCDLHLDRFLVSDFHGF